MIDEGPRLCIWQHHPGISRSPWHKIVEGWEGRVDDMEILEGLETEIPSLSLGLGGEEELEARRSCPEEEYSAASSFLPSPQ